MRRVGFALAMVAVVAAAAWAYHVNYETKMALAQVDRLHEQIAAEREAVEVLRVEWAYLNAPDRLARLVAMNNDRLDLVPMGPHHFDEVALVPFPPRPEPRLPEEGVEPASGDVPMAAAPQSDRFATLGDDRATAPAPPEIVSEQASRVAAAIPVPQPRPASWGRQ